jgi:hypothetical protein
MPHQAIIEKTTGSERGQALGPCQKGAFVIKKEKIS